MNRKILIPALALAVVALAGTTGIAAAANSSQYSGLVQALASKFNLDPAAVQQVVTQYRQQQGQKFEDNLEAKLQADVTAGKLTQAQKDALVAKLQQLRTDLQNVQNEPAAQRKTDRQRLMADFRTWAQSQGIDLGKILPRGIWRHGMVGDGSQ